MTAHVAAPWSAEDLATLAMIKEDDTATGTVVHRLLATIDNCKALTAIAIEQGAQLLAARDAEIAGLKNKIDDFPCCGQCHNTAARVAQLEAALRKIETGPFGDSKGSWNWEDMKVIASDALKGTP